MSKISVSCMQCGKEILKTKSQLRDRNFCSRSCTSKYRYDNDGCDALKCRSKDVKEKASLVRKLKFKAKYPLLFKKHYLKFKYTILKYSVEELAKDVGCSSQAIKNRLKDLKIELRSVTESKSTERYLSKYRGKNNWMFISGYSDSYRGKGWKKNKQLTLARDNNTCQICGLTQDTNLDVHHKIPYRFTQDSSVSNLITLCVRCHKAEDYELIQLLHKDKKKFAKYLGINDMQVEEGLNYDRRDTED